MTTSLQLRKLSSPLRASVHLPGSKSYTNRALAIASLCDGESLLRSFSPSDDSTALIAGLGKLGVACEETPEGLVVKGKGGRFAPYQGTIDVGPAGTTIRFLTSLCCMAEGAEVELRGSERMHARPIGDLVEAWRHLGACIEYLGLEGCPPLRIRGHRNYKFQTSMRGDVSSQFFSSMLMIAPLFSEPFVLDVEGVQTSPSYIDMTLQTMADFGVEVQHNSYQQYKVAPGQSYSPRTYHVEGDASGASYFWGLAAVSGGYVKVGNLSPQSVQGDVHFAQLLEQMGCVVSSGVEEDVPWIAVQGPESLKPIEVDMGSMPDTALTLATIAAVAGGTTRITGLHTLRHKETDRLEALHNELSAVGIQSEVGEDWLAIEGGTPRPASIHTYEDHRMAMAFAVLAGCTDNLEILEPQVVSKSFPSFWEEWSRMGVGIER
ncbi:MAG: 3-phosphoshikimate 1-carboxyvinyltransferase [Deltaproteobacteria bacterium]|nr:MAG: 3-phosphoshikimate 1-carboxyvinyltransferase [Deltaproteobacteria bacterium]